MQNVELADSANPSISTFPDRPNVERRETEFHGDRKAIFQRYRRLSLSRTELASRDERKRERKRGNRKNYCRLVNIASRGDSGRHAKEKKKSVRANAQGPDEISVRGNEISVIAAGNADPKIQLRYG